MGINPYDNLCYLDTFLLSKQIVNSMAAGGDHEEVDMTTYTRNLAVLVCFHDNNINCNA